MALGKRQEIEVPSRSIIDDMRPDVPPEETSQGRKEDTKVVDGDALDKDAVRVQDPHRKKPKTERCERKANPTGNTPEEDAYLESFIDTPPLAMIARNGKLAYLTPRNHQRILKVISVIGHNQVNIATFLNRIVCDHFDRNDAVIRSLLEKGYSEEF